MKTQLNKLASSAAAFGLFLVGCVMAGLGVSVLVLMAMFGLAIMGLAFLASPLLMLAQKQDPDIAEEATA